MGFEVHTSGPILRIVSLVPSQTELLYELGLENEVVGITRFCIHPKKWFYSKKRVGGTKDFDIEKIKALKPDLILANKEENDEQNLKVLQSQFPVWVSDVKTLDDAKEMILSIGEITEREKEVKKLSEEIKAGFEQLNFSKKIKALYFIWREPWMVAGQDTFISEMMAFAGFQNMEMRDRYPEVELTNLEPPEIILLSSEPYPFKEKHINELSTRFPNTPIFLVDGEQFSWYGSRLKRSPSYFSKLRTQIYAE